MDRRTIYVLRYPAHLFAAHMALFVPHAGDDDVGKVLHATGDQRSGFVHEFKRNYSALDTARLPEKYALGSVHAGVVVDVVDDGALVIDTEPVDAHDEIERVALSVPAPGPSLRTATGALEVSAGVCCARGSWLSAAQQGKLTRIEVRNCQTWLREVVNALVQQGLLEDTALIAFDDIPK